MKLKILLLVMLMSAVLAGPLFAALDAYLYLEGDNQGQIKGSVTRTGREDSIMVIAYSHDLSVPRDPNSGMTTGKRWLFSRHSIITEIHVL